MSTPRSAVTYTSFLRLNDEDFGVLGDVLSFASPVFAGHFRAHGSSAPYQVASQVSRSDVQAFIDACHSRLYQTQFQVTRENALGLSLLCDEFQVADLQQQVRAFLHDNDGSMLLPTINFYLEHDGDTSELERQLKANLPAFLNSPELLTLPYTFFGRCILI
jgi:hypothetical protein